MIPAGSQAKRFRDTLVEDVKIRKYLKQRLYKAGVPSIEIERDDKSENPYPLCEARYRHRSKGAEIENRNDVEKMTNGKPVNLNIIEVRNPDLNAQLVAENIASQLEGRVSFRRI